MTSLSLLTFYVSLSSTENKIGPEYISKKEKNNVQTIFVSKVLECRSCCLIYDV